MGRLSRTDWLEHGLKALAAGGPRALRADPLCKRIGVSRGSFYWHFEHLDDFHTALLAHWRDESRRVAALSSEADDPLAALMAHTGARDPEERAIRAWGLQDERVAAAVREVDQLREGVVARFLQPHPNAAVLARLIYCAALGRVWTGQGPHDEHVMGWILDQVSAAGMVE